MTAIEASKRAVKLCKHLHETVGGEWVPKVWENSGWHFRAALEGGSIGVSESNAMGKYHCSMDDKPGSYSATPTVWSDPGHYDTPEEAVFGQLRRGVEVVNWVQGALDMNLEALKMD